MPTIKPATTAGTHLQGCPPRKLRMRKHRILAPESWGPCQRNNFSESRLLHLPMYRKALNSLTWDISFSLINSHLLMFWSPGFCYKTSIYLAPPLSLQSGSLRAIWESYLLGLTFSGNLPNKTQLTTLMLCIFLFSQYYAGKTPCK